MQHETSTRSFDPFRSFPAEARQRHLASYLQFLEQLDGTVDFEQRRLSRRERFFDELASKPVEWQGPLDHAGFEENFETAGGGELDRRTAWLVVAAKANTGECFGVEQELRRIEASGEWATMDELHLRMLLQEEYHTRILGEACRTLGVEVTTPIPHWNQRVLIHSAMRLPDSLRWILVLCGEVVGCAIFDTLLQNADAFSAEPEVEERLRSLLTEIRRDEVLHVAYLRARVGRLGLRIARTMVPMVLSAALLDLPQLAVLSTSREELMARVRAGIELPADVSWMQPDPALA